MGEIYRDDVILEPCRNSDVLESSMINNVVGIVIAFDMNGVYCRLRLYAIDKLTSIIS